MMAKSGKIYMASGRVVQIQTDKIYEMGNYQPLEVTLGPIDHEALAEWLGIRLLRRGNVCRIGQI